MSLDQEKSINADDEFRSALRIGNEAKEVAATKAFAVNATGNLFVATTLNGGEAGNADISEEAKIAFGQVSVFFAAMTKAMVENDSTSKVYDYETINEIVSKSGMFVKVTDSEIIFKSSAWGIKFGQDLITTLLGLSGGLNTIAKSLTDMIVGIGKKADGIEIGADNQQSRKKVGTIVFVCEYLLGAVSITPIVLSIDAEDAQKAYRAGPCFKANSKENKIDIVKQVYSFVPPEFMKQAVALNEAMNNEQFLDLVKQLKGYISQS